MFTEALVFLAAIATFFLSRRSPWQAICLVIFLLPAYVVRLRIAGLPTNAFEVLLLAAVIAAASLPDAKKNTAAALHLVPRSVKIWVGVFLLAACVSTVISPQTRVSLGILKGWIIIPMAAAALILAVRPTDTQKKQLLHALIASSVAVSMVALVMGRVGGRLQAFYDSPNSLALFVAPMLTATLWQAEHDKQHKRWLIAAAALQVMAIIGAQSVGAVIAIAAALGVGISLWVKRGKVKTLAGLLLAAAIAAWIFWQTGKISYLLQPITNPSTHNSATVRLQLWSIGWDLIKENPLRGIGLGQFEPAYQQKLHQRFAAGNVLLTPYSSPLTSEFVFRDPHNWPIAFWLNTGLLGLISFVSLNIVAIKKMRREQSPILTAYSLLLTTILLFGLVDTIYWKNDLATIWWVAVAALL